MSHSHSASKTLDLSASPVVKFLLQDYSRTVHCCVVSAQRPHLSTFRAPHCMECGDEPGAPHSTVIPVNGWWFCYLLDAGQDNQRVWRRFVRGLRRQPDGVIFVLEPPRLEYIDFKL